MVRVDDELNLTTLSDVNEPNLGAPHYLDEVRLARPFNPYKIAFYIALVVLAMAWMARSRSAQNTTTVATAEPSYQPANQQRYVPQGTVQPATQVPAILASPTQSSAAQEPSPADQMVALAIYERLTTEQQNRVQDFLNGLRPESAEDPAAGSQESPGASSVPKAEAHESLH